MPDLPPVRSAPCFDCPWRRVSLPGWTGPFSPEEWVSMAHSDIAIACHTTLPGEDADESYDHDDEDPDTWNAPGVLQCAGAAIYRSNIFKSPRNPQVATLPSDTDTVFGRGEFEAHHNRIDL